MHELMKTGEDATTYIDTILQYCPHIQIFNGYTPSIRPSDGTVEGEGFWPVDLPVWDRFCRGCEQLEVFEWRCVPFATRLFEVIGSYTKPKLRVLKFSVSCCWDWDQYFDTVGPAARAKLEMTGLGDTAVLPESALRATPNLESHIEWDELSWQMDTLNVNTEVFGDVFVVAVAAHCPKLTRIVNDVMPFHGPYCLTSFSHRSMRALATLPHLASITMEAGSYTGNGLFDLVVKHAASTTQARTVGDDIIFYGILEEFLERLVAHTSPSPRAKRRVAMLFGNLDERTSRRRYQGKYWHRIQELVGKARTIHKSLRLRLLWHRSRRDSNTMKRIDQFAFATESVDIADLAKGEGVSIDGVFPSREVEGNVTDTDDDGNEDDNDDDDRNERERERSE